MNDRNRLIALSMKMKGDFLQMYEAWRQDPHLTEFVGVFDDILAVTIIDEHYPFVLRQLDKPPFVIFYEGNLSLLEKKTLGLIGTPQPSDYAKMTLKEVMKSINEQTVLVSGFDKGSSLLAVETFKDRGNVVGVMPQGLASVSAHTVNRSFISSTHDYCLISEYPPKTPFSMKRMYERNRLICAISQELLSIEPPRVGMVMNTCLEAIDMGRCVYVLPDKLSETCAHGSFELIEQGAHCLTRFSLS